MTVRGYAQSVSRAGKTRRGLAAMRLFRPAKSLAVIASAAKQSRVRAVDSGLLRRLRLLAMTSPGLWRGVSVPNLSITVALVVIGLTMAQAQAQPADLLRQDLPSADIVPDRPASSAPVAPADPSVQSGAGLPACLVWSDGCVTCERADGKISCSNIGIACQPQAPRCLKAEDK
jgi:hypothetical protein